MDAGLLMQHAIVAFAVALSAAFVFKRQFPGVLRTLRLALAQPLVRASDGTLRRRIGRVVAPAPPSGGACARCNGCAAADKSGR